MSPKKDAWNRLASLAARAGAQPIPEPADSAISRIAHDAAHRLRPQRDIDVAAVAFLLRRAVALGVFLIVVSLAFLLLAPARPSLDGWTYATVRLSETLSP